MEFLGVDNFFGFVSTGVSGSESSFVLLETSLHIPSVSRVVGSVLAEENVDVVDHRVGYFA